VTDRRVVYSTEHGKTKTKPGRSRPAARPGTRHGVHICYESKGRGGKVVCVITGLPLTGAELKVLSKRLKAALGTGGAVKNGNIEIQGDHRERLLALLETEGFRARLSGG